jgi:hypothetical protein
MTKVCRICLEDDPKQGLIAPCKCKGTSKWVHRECLETWRQERLLASIQCSVCKFEYELDLSGEWSIDEQTTCQLFGIFVLVWLQLILGVTLTQLYIIRKEPPRTFCEPVPISGDEYIAFAAIGLFSFFYSIGYMSTRWAMGLVSYWYNMDHGFYPDDWRHWETGQNKLRPKEYFCFVVLGVFLEGIAVYCLVQGVYNGEKNRRSTQRPSGRVKDLSRRSVNMTST